MSGIDSTSWYFEQSTANECGGISFQHNGPDWVQTSANVLIIDSNSFDDEPITITVTLTASLVDYQVPSTDIELELSLVCPQDSTCGSELSSSKDPESLQTTDADCNQWFEGALLENSYLQTYEVPYRYYRLSKVEMWHYGTDISGFRMTFEVPDDFIGWLPYTLMFGFQDGPNTAELDIDRELQEL